MKYYQKLIPAAMMLGIIVTACGGGSKPDTEALDLGQKVARFASQNQLDSLAAIYPAAKDCDSLSLSYTPDSIKVEATGTADEYKVVFNPEAYIMVNVPKEGTPTVTATYGLFAYPAAEKEFALKTGLITADMNDVETAARMKELPALKQAIYDAYVSSNKTALKVGKLVVTEESSGPTWWPEGGAGYYPISNATDHEIKASEYSIILKETNMRGLDTPTSYTTKKGGDIPAGGMYKFNLELIPSVDTEVSVKMNTLSEADYFASYTPTGDEYEKYLAKK